MHRPIASSSVLLLSLALVAGCTPAGSGDLPMTDSGTTPDAGTPPTDSGGPACMNHVPTSGFGTRVGANFAEITLNDCDGVPHNFYDTSSDPVKSYCTNTLTVVTIAAGWCHPCNLEADQLQAMLIGPYASRGVRTIQVLTQDDNFHVPTASFCRAWMNRTNGWPSSAGYFTPPDTAANHVLSATDHLTLLDPTGLTQIYNPADSIPATVIVDGDGVIQLRFNGTSTDPASGGAALTEMTTCLDKLLSTPRVLCH